MLTNIKVPDQLAGNYEIHGLSTDTKPVDDSIVNGSIFIEMDTSSIYFYDGENKTWILFNTAN